MPGRHAKSFKILNFTRGTLYGYEKQREETEPAQKSKIEPVCPKDFSKREKEIWHEYAKILKDYDLFLLANGPLLTLLVKNISDREKCIRLVKKQGICIESYKGIVYNPYWTAKNRCEENILKHLNLLGLSSIGLAKVGSLSSHGTKTSELDELMD